LADQGQSPTGDAPGSSMPRSSMPDEGVTAADFTVRRALAELAFLRPDSQESESAAPAPAMPPDVWANIVLTLQAEQVRRSHGWRRGPRMLTAVVAAAAVVIAGGVVVQSRQSSDPAPVAAEVVAPQLATAAQPSANDAGGDSGRIAAPREPGGPELNPGAPAIKGNLAPSTLGDARLPASPGLDGDLTDSGAIAPARRVLASGTNYRAETLGDQVESLLARLGITSQRELEQLPQQAEPLAAGDSGFTASEAALSGCLVTLRGPITAISQQAYVVDRAQFAGQDVGLVLLPADTASTPLMIPEPSETLGTNIGLIDIWIVTPSCGPLGVTPVHHVLHQLSFP